MADPNADAVFRINSANGHQTLLTLDLFDPLSIAVVPGGPVVPEPATGVLLMTGLLALASHRKKRRQ